MVETEWPEIGGKEVRYRDARWELTGAVDVQDDGALLAAAATRTDDNRHGRARLFFRVDDVPESLNPGNLGTHFDSLDRSGNRTALVVKAAGRTYRYPLHRLEYE